MTKQKTEISVPLLGSSLKDAIDVMQSSSSGLGSKEGAGLIIHLFVNDLDFGSTPNQTAIYNLFGLSPDASPTKYKALVDILGKLKVDFLNTPLETLVNAPAYVQQAELLDDLLEGKSVR